MFSGLVLWRLVCVCRSKFDYFLVFFVVLRWFLGALVFDVCGTGDVLSVL